MNIELVTRTELDEWCKKMDAQLQKATQVGQEGEPVVYDNDALSRKLKVSKRTLQNWRDGGLIKFSQIGHKIYYTGESVNNFLKNNEVKNWGK